MLDNINVIFREHLPRIVCFVFINCHLNGYIEPKSFDIDLQNKILHGSEDNNDDNEDANDSEDEHRVLKIQGL